VPPPSPPNRPPVAADDTVTVAAGTSVVIRPLLNDRDPDGDPVTVVAIRKPRHGTVTMTATTVTYTAVAGPARSDRAAALGADTVGYTVGDGRGGRSTASVTIHLVLVADMPVTGHEVLALVRAGLLAIAAGGTLCWLSCRETRRRPGAHRAPVERATTPATGSPTGAASPWSR
jgi:hypothetical protein